MKFQHNSTFCIWLLVSGAAIGGGIGVQWGVMGILVGLTSGAFIVAEILGRARNGQ